ncbi:regulator of Sig8 [Mycobacterium kyorinense]|uniref:Regulator of Sig8 n=1 Tax=Mycobacterium kyorinense TaxID=487514 RepID=A0A1A2Z0A6_9MYCO|nr:anti-sigma factor RsbA family regulatory protein [Mycobacterium kyorinense]OBI43720.1 regulator of Sig8 [Mycobacterium kyorinense]
MTTTHNANRPVHGALFYCSEREYIDSVVRFVSEWLSVAQPVLVAVPGDKIGLLRDALGPAARKVTMIDITEEGRNPGRLIGLLATFVERHGHQPVRIIGEPIWPERSAVEYPACVQHEALVNVALADQDVTGVCLYDATRLGDGALADARRTHPTIWQDGSAEVNPDYAVDDALAQCNQPLSTSPVAVTSTVCQPADLANARRCSTRYGRLLGMSSDRLADLQLITTELATNSLDHGGGVCRLAFWHEAGHVVCEARDIGYLTDPLAGRRRPNARHAGPYGLFVVNAIADLVRTHTTPDGTTIQAYLQLDRPLVEA